MWMDEYIWIWMDGWMDDDECMNDDYNDRIN